MATTVASKLPPNWFKQGCNMAYQVVYLMKVYNIILTLIIKSDQTSVHLIPTTRERIWESKGSRHIQVLGVENKRQITMVVFLATNGFSLSPLDCVDKNYSSLSTTI
jgi:hypothetical protein